jgi:uncharacterized protein YdaU (DUF1376 family)
MSRELPYFRWYPKDAQADLKFRAMTRSQRGLYHDALDFAWINDGLPDDDGAIRRALGMTVRELKADWPVVRERFEETGGTLRNARQEQERSEALRLSDKRAKAGAEGGKRKAIATALPEFCSDKQAIRAYGSVFESGFVSEKKKKEAHPQNGEWPHAQTFTESWRRHLKQRRDQPLEVVAQVLIGRNGSLDWDELARAHPAYCAYWEKRGWDFCPLTLLEWIDGGMLPPPAEAVAQKESRAERRAREMDAEAMA